MIYIVEDDDNIRELESYALKNSGFDVESFEKAEDMFDCLDLNNLPELILLDIMLPEMDGTKVLTQLKNNVQTSEIPVIMVTAKSSEIDKVKSLDNGADDYITKPFGVMELVSRVKALLRRTQKVSSESNLEYKNIKLNDEKRIILIGDEKADLTYKEFELLKYLIINKGIVLSREKILQTVWGYEFEGESRTVDMHIKTLRQKLGDNGKDITTIRNVGYKLGE